MRILHAYKIYRPDIEGGIPAVMSSLAQGSDQNISHSILCARRRGAARQYTIDGVLVEAVASLGTLFSTPLAPGYIPAFVRRAASADVVVHHAPLPLNDAAILLGLPDDVGLIVYWHAEIVGYPLLKCLVAPLIRRVLARADRIVVSGQPIIDNSEFLRPHAEKCDVLAYGMDLDYWRTLDASERASADELRRRQPRHIVALGRLVGYKGYDVLVRAMRTIDGYTTIVGEGPLLAELQHLATTLGVSDRIRFAGRLTRSEIKQLFYSARVFAFPSVTEAEAFGIVQIEAMAAGLPIVNTHLATTVPLVARHGREALTVAPNDPQALSQALSRILDEPALAERLGSGGRERANSEFDQVVFRERMAAIYEEAVLARKYRGTARR
ncbi:glycosyltransferase [Bradyrhizobium erythrophlei]|uniref:Rhamnosyl/mannosyltransferase n=1 Tax=Bradyrhizobium erythrophlei TaxID=1437360 RepID=A0A1M5UPJ5_9BRAD|nr:glycosyltransferase [Bradyrhizobium erythrophlei]SHH64907.1 rhamnosyl/mannosyltransferase [Bradyrhizobium erythrophlei]